MGSNLLNVFAKLGPISSIERSETTLMLEPLFHDQDKFETFWLRFVGGVAFWNLRAHWVPCYRKRIRFPFWIFKNPKRSFARTMEKEIQERVENFRLWSNFWIFCFHVVSCYRKRKNIRKSAFLFFCFFVVVFFFNSKTSGWPCDPGEQQKLKFERKPCNRSIDNRCHRRTTDEFRFYGLCWHSQAELKWISPSQIRWPSKGIRIHRVNFAAGASNKVNESTHFIVFLTRASGAYYIVAANPAIYSK